MSGDVADLTGRTLRGTYRIVRPLATGGMGTVYEAIQEGLGRKVAVKVVREELANDTQLLERFRREALSSAALGHPNIVQVTDFFMGDADTPPYLVMEYLEGSDLIGVVNTEGPLSQSRAASMAVQVLAALGAAHREQIIHRDLKASNIVLVPVADGSDLAKVLDFGIAKVREGPGFSRLTQTGVVVGTPGYMAPEQALGKEIDGRSDLYALGVVLYIVVTGHKPFVARSDAELLTKIVHAPPTPMSQHRSDLDPAFCAVVERALAKNPDDRFPDAAAMAEALRPFVERASLAPVASQPPPASLPPPHAVSNVPGVSHPPDGQGFAAASVPPEQRPSAASIAAPAAAQPKRRLKLVVVGVIAVLGVAAVVTGIVLLTVFAGGEEAQAGTNAATVDAGVAPLPGLTPTAGGGLAPASPDKPIRHAELIAIITRDLDEASVRLRFQSRTDEIDLCFSDATPGAGRYTWDLAINDGGMVAGSEHRYEGPQLPQADQCMRTLFQSIGFPAAAPGTTAAVSLVFVPAP